MYGMQQNPCAEYYQYKVVEPAAVLPLDITFVRNYLKIDTADDDDLIMLLIGAATDFAEMYTRRTFISTRYQTYRNCFPSGCCGIQLQQSPFLGIDEFAYLNTENVWTDVDPTIYYVTDEPAYVSILLDDGKSYPSYSMISRRRQAIQILFRAGYGLSPDDVPLDIKDALLQLIADMYVNRGDCTPTSRRAASCSCSSFLTGASKDILNQHRIMSL